MKNLKDFKVNLPSNWKEISSFGTERQISIKIYHINPVSLVGPEVLKTQSIPSDNPNVNIVRVAVPIPTLPLSAFYDGMKLAILSGFVPGYSLEKLDQTFHQTTEVYHPGDGDISGSINITQYENEEVARQSFNGMRLMPTLGFDAPVPGLSDGTTFVQLLDKKEVSGQIPKDQMEKIKEIISNASNNSPKEEIYKEGKYFGYDALYMEDKKKPQVKKPRSKSKGGGGGFDDTLDPLPKIPKDDGDKRFYHSLLVNRFVITGELLWMASLLPSGKTPCYSLTRTRKKTSSFREDDQTFTNIMIIPLPSNYAQEGYLHREEVEKILKNTISQFLQS